MLHHRPPHDGHVDPHGTDTGHANLPGARAHDAFAHAHDEGHPHAATSSGRTQHPAHQHTHHPTPRSFDRAFAWGIALNLAFVAVEAWFGWQADSLALLADAGHNLSDVAGLVLAWGGALAGRLRPDARHSYGWQRASILAAFANALLLLVAMGSLAWEAAHRLAAPEPTQGLTMIAVAAVGIFVNGVTAVLFMRGGEQDLNIRGAFAHMAADALVSLGVVMAGVVYLWRGWAWIDPAASLLIASVIVWGTWGLFRQSLHLLFDGVPEHVNLPAVRECLQSLPGVQRVSDLHIWAMATDRVALTAHLVRPEGGADDGFYRLATQELRRRFGIAHVTLQVVQAPVMRGCADEG